jgi:HEAT repeat protein
MLPEDRNSKMSIFTGEPVEDMEIAKRLIGQFPRVDYASLMAIAADQRQPQSARIAAIYTLGLTDEKRQSQATLRHISGNPREPADVRDHAAEALESITPSEGGL